VERPLYFALAIADLQLQPKHLFTPDIALIALTIGILLIYVELNRPGRILPGALGLLLALLAMPSLFANGIHSVALPLLLGTSVIILALGLRCKVHIIASVAATIGLALSFNAIEGVHTAFAIASGLLLGVTSSLLAHIARRARANKGLDLEKARSSRPGATKS
jgi:membrane-bound serine protease (ClpP class)